jgi:hypothetical protein
MSFLARQKLAYGTCPNLMGAGVNAVWMCPQRIAGGIMRPSSLVSNREHLFLDPNVCCGT